jgi:hypothetical protein
MGKLLSESAQGSEHGVPPSLAGQTAR